MQARADTITVAVIDDHAMFAESLTRILDAQDDIEVVGSARTMADGVELVSRLRPSVVLADYQLPDGDGAKVAAAVKAMLPDTHVLMVTGTTSDAALLAAIEAGCTGYVTKDQAVDELVQAVRGAAGGEVLIPPAMLARVLPKLRRDHRRIGSDLTPRELEVLHMLAEGLSNKEIAARLVVSVNTARNHVQNLLTKLHAHSKLEAVATAVREGIVER